MEERLLIVGEDREANAIKEIIEAIQNTMSLEQRQTVAVSICAVQAEPQTGAREKAEAEQRQQEQWEQLAIRYPFAAVALPEAKQRLNVIARLEACCYTIITLLHPESAVSPAASLGKGCIVYPMAVIEAGATLGTAVWVKAGAIVERDCLIGDACLLESGSIVRSGSIVPPGTTLRSGEVFCRDAAEVFWELQQTWDKDSFEVEM